MSNTNSYSTVGFEGERSVEAWRQALGEVYYRLDTKPAQADGLRGEILDWQSDVIGVSDFRTDAQRVIRHKASARADGSEDFVFLFPTRKAMRYEQRGREGLVVPGGVFLLNSAESYIVDIPDGSENITIKIDRDYLAGRVSAGIDDLCATSNFTNPLLIPVLTTLGEQVLKLKSSEHVTRIQECITELVCLMLECRTSEHSGDLVRETLGTTLFNQICAYIRRNLGDHALSPEKAAAEHRISLRYLHKIFNYRGTSFGQVLMEERLHQAQSLIAVASHRERINLGEVAYRCGFTNQSHFSASYKRFFGVSPRQTSTLGLK